MQCVVSASGSIYDARNRSLMNNNVTLDGWVLQKDAYTFTRDNQSELLRIGGYTEVTTCDGTADPCTNFAENETGCIRQVPCSYTAEFCGGTPSDCTFHGDEPTCTLAGCTWDPGMWMCSGTPNACSTHSVQADCDSVGCAWSMNACDGAEQPCADFGENKTGCENQLGCSWSQTNENYRAFFDFNISVIPDSARIQEVNLSFVVNQTTNNSHIIIVALNPNASDYTKQGRSIKSLWEAINYSDTWYTNITDTFVNHTSPCEGSVRTCPSLDGEEDLCTNQSGCSWDGVCSGVANSCGGMVNESQCLNQTTCSWDPESCSGTPQGCDMYWDQMGCEDAGCTWDEMMFMCSGTPNACSTYSEQFGCEGAMCTWNTAMCSGTEDACSTKTANYSCIFQDGCIWSGCTITPNAEPCNQMRDRNRCLQQKPCTWPRLIYNLTSPASINFTSSLMSDWWRFGLVAYGLGSQTAEADREATIFSNNTIYEYLRPQLIIKYTPADCYWDGNSTWFINWSHNCIINGTVDIENNTLQMIGLSGSLTFNNGSRVFAKQILGVTSAVNTVFAMLDNSTLGLLV